MPDPLVREEWGEGALPESRAAMPSGVSPTAGVALYRFDVSPSTAAGGFAPDVETCFAPGLEPGFAPDFEACFAPGLFPGFALDC